MFEDSVENRGSAGDYQSLPNLVTERDSNELWQELANEESQESPSMPTSSNGKDNGRS